MQQLIDKGWKNYYSCNCGGTPKQYWNNDKYPTYEIILRPRRNTFTLMSKNMIIKGPDWTYKLEQALKDYGING